MEKKVLKVFVVLIIFSVSLINTVYHSNSDEGLNMVTLADISVMARADGENPGGVNCTGPSCNKYYNSRYENGIRVECCGKFDAYSTGSRGV